MLTYNIRIVIVMVQFLISHLNILLRLYFSPQLIFYPPIFSPTKYLLLKIKWYSIENQNLEKSSSIEHLNR